MNRVTRSNSFWVLNRLMLIGAALGFFMGNAALEFVDVVRHQGPGFVAYHDDESGNDHREKVSESQFKRYKFSEYGLLLVIGAFFWVEVARRAKDDHSRGDSPETNAE